MWRQYLKHSNANSTFSLILPTRRTQSQRTNARSFEWMATAPAPGDARAWSDYRALSSSSSRAVPLSWKISRNRNRGRTCRQIAKILRVFSPLRSGGPALPVNSAGSWSKTNLVPSSIFSSFLLSRSPLPCQSFVSLIRSSTSSYHPYLVSILLPSLPPPSSSKYRNIQILSGHRACNRAWEAPPPLPPSVRKTKSQRTPLSNSFAHPITFHYYVQKFAVH